MANIKNIKDQIKTELDALVTATTLGSAKIQDLKADPLRDEYSAFPAAILTPPALVGSEALDNRTNLRQYEFRIVMLWQPENETDTSQIEADMEAMANHFDNKFSLEGDADGGVGPAYSAPEPLQYGEQTWIFAELILRVGVTQSLSFS